MTDNWRKKTLDELVESTLIGLVKNKSEQDDNKAFIYIKMHNITPDNKLDTSKVVRVDALAEEVEKYKLSEGDFLFNTRNSHELVGKSCIFSMPKMQPILFNNNIMRIRFTPEVDSKFIAYSFSSQYISEQLESIKNGTTNVSAIYYSSLKNVAITYPHLPEQKRIVAILDEAFEGIDRAIANTEKNLANARELFENYLNTIFTQKGDGWEEKKLEDICSIKHGFAFKGEFFTNNPSQYILLTPGSFHESGGYREQGEKTKYYVGEVPDTYILRKGDFLFVMTEQAVGLLGSSLIVPESNRFLHNQRLGLVEVFNGFEWHNDFFFHQFNTQGFRAAVQSSASGVKVRHTSPKKLGAIKVFFPRTKAEQKAVADTLNELYAETQRLEAIYRQKIAALKELKQSILQKAFTGELTADNANQVKKTAKEINAA